MMNPVFTHHNSEQSRLGSEVEILHRFVQTTEHFGFFFLLWLSKLLYVIRSPLFEPYQHKHLFHN